MTSRKQHEPIGELIRHEFEKLPRTYTVTWFAKNLNCDRTNIYDIFSRQSIDTALLMRISCILHHDFFVDLSAQYKQVAAADSETITPPDSKTRRRSSGHRQAKSPGDSDEDKK